MPFTPFHFGPGLLAKELFPRRFSLTAFVTAQVLIDFEPLYHMVRHEYPVHRGLHTLVGATLAGAAAAGLVLCARRLRPRSTTESILIGGLAGGASHPLLDALMHADVHPFAPFTGANPLLDATSLVALHAVCILAGTVGLALTGRRLNRDMTAEV